MSARMNCGLAVVSAAVSVLLAGSAWAGIVQPIDVPEPGLIGIIAAASVGVILAARLKSK